MTKRQQLIIAWVIVLSFLLVCSVYADNQEEVAEIQKQIIEKFMNGDLADLNVTQKEVIRGIIMEADPSFFDIDRIDLDKNGMNEVIFTYVCGAHSSGAKVIKFKEDKLVILFEHGSGTPNTQFKIVNNVPTLIFEESDYNPDYNAGKRYEEVYLWDGKTFSKKNE